jgi:hypothetical protein
MPAKTRLDTGRRGAGKISSSLFRIGALVDLPLPDFIHFRDRGSTRGNALMLVSSPAIDQPTCHQLAGSIIQSLPASRVIILASLMCRVRLPIAAFVPRFHMRL